MSETSGSVVNPEICELLLRLVGDISDSAPISKEDTERLIEWQALGCGEAEIGTMLTVVGSPMAAVVVMLYGFAPLEIHVYDKAWGQFQKLNSSAEALSFQKLWEFEKSCRQGEFC
jgi:hypothetical protein